MGLAPGEKLGPYEIIAPVGAGGMGEVYRARDTRLARDVAIKVVSRTLAKDPDRLRRFEQEAKTIAVLNHPNILGIHDIGMHDGAPYLVSELLEGDTLRQKLMDGPLPVRRAVEYALGMAKGLAAAHDKGIVHRDLKPENIFIARDGRVKILDFGLAKLVRPDPGTETTLTTANPETVTQPGVVVGTVGYMSPEQVRGESIDARSDIFSFGAVFYEMLTGKRAFKKDTTAETMTAILREEPPELAETGWQGPLELQRILSRCLEKNVERRFQSASDLAFAIESLSGTAVTQKLSQQALAVKRPWWPWLAAAAAVILLAGASWLAGRWSAATALPKFVRLTYERGYVWNARFASDGQTIIYSAQWNNDPIQVYSVRTEFPQSVKVDLPSATLFALSSAGSLQLGLDPTHHYNFLSGTLAQAEMAGGSPRALQTDVIAADFAPDGKTLAISRQIGGKVQVEYPVGKVIYTTSGYADYLRVSPDGQKVAFLEHSVYDDDRGWVATVDQSGNHRQLTQEYASIQGLAWAKNGREIWYTASQEVDLQMYAVTMDGKEHEVLTGPQHMRILDIGSDGRALVAAESYRQEITAIDPQTGKERHGMEWFNGSGLSDITPDGKAILFSEWGGNVGPLYVVSYRKLDGSAPVALGPGGRPRLSPDGKNAAAIVYTQPPQIALHPIGMGESRRLSLGDIESVNFVNWFPDGKHLLLRAAKRGEDLRSYEMDTDDGKPVPLGPSDWFGIAVAPDGKRIAGYKNSGDAVVYDLETQKFSPIPGIEPGERLHRWTEDGEAVLVQLNSPGGARLSRVAVATGKRTLVKEIEVSDRAGLESQLDLFYAERSGTYAYNVRRLLGNLYVVEGLK